MGNSISIDKHVSNLDDLLEISSNYYSKIKFESKVSHTITQHLKIWKFFEDNKKVDLIKTLPVPLANIQTSGFNFSSEESYLILLIYKTSAEENCELVNFPHSLMGIVESVSNLTPRGLLSTYSSSHDNTHLSVNYDNLYVESLESFLLSKRQEMNTKFKYLLFVWNGKNANSLVKALALTKGYELDTLLNKAKDILLEVLFSGGVIRRKKLQRGAVLCFEDVINKISNKSKSTGGSSNHSSENIADSLLKKRSEAEGSKGSSGISLELKPSSESQGSVQVCSGQGTGSKATSLIKAYETVYLLRWWLPEQSLKNAMDGYGLNQQQDKKKSVKFPRFAQLIYSEPVDPQCSEEKKHSSTVVGENSYFNRFKNVSDDEDDMDLEHSLEEIGEEPMGRDSMEFDKENMGKTPEKAQLLFSIQKKASEEVPEEAKLVGKRLNFNLEMDKLKLDQKEKEKPLNLGSVGGGGKVPKFALPLGGLGGKRKESENENKGEPENKLQNNLKINLNLQNIKKNEEFEKKTGNLAEESDSSERNSGKKGFGLSMAGLQTREEERRNLVYNPDKKFDEDQIRDTNRRDLENEYYKRRMSPIIPDLLYLGGDWVAQNKQILEENQITHIINCSGDYSDQYFPQDFIYKTYFLKDSVRENIECTFYDSIEFIENAKKKGGRIYVHCVQGVSRSTTICLAYLIFSKKMTCQSAFDLVQKLRPIANPNMIFNAQLFWWHMRLYQEYSSLPVSPRIFSVGSHQIEQPTYLVSRLLMEHMYEKSGGKVLDPRGVFIIQNQNKLILWIGNEIQGNNYQKFLDQAYKTIFLLQKYENASPNVEVVKQNTEISELWNLWNLPSPPSKKYDYFEDWDGWFADVDNAEASRPKVKPLVYEHDRNKKDKNSEDELELKKLQESKPRLYTYPEAKVFSTVFDMEELIEDSLLLLCLKNKNKIHVWKGPSFVHNREMNEESFLSKVKEHCWEDRRSSSIEIQKEVMQEESESFMDCFD